MNQLRSARRSATLIFLNLYLRHLAGGSIIDRIAQEVPAAGMQQEQTVEWWTAFPTMRHWKGERMVQEVFAEAIKLYLEPYEITYKMDRFKLELDGGSSLLTEPDRMGPHFANGYIQGRLEKAYRPLRNNLITYDKQNFFDTDHVHPNGDPFSNLLAVPRANNAEPTVMEASRELKAMQTRLEHNRLVRTGLVEVAGDSTDLTVIVKSNAVHEIYKDLRLEEKLPDNTKNRFQNKFTLVRDYNPLPGDENDVDCVWSEPGGPRPSVMITARDPGPILPLQPENDRRGRDILYGNDAIYAFGAGFPQTAVRRKQAVL